MGHSIETIGKHNFPYQNLNELARQFAQRYNLNLQVGYALQYPTNLNQTAIDASFDFVLLDEIEIPGAQKSARLYDEHYHARQLYQQYGAALFDTPFAKANSSVKDEVLFSIQNYRYNIINPDTGEDWCTISNNFLQCWLYYYNRWWFFCNQFTTRNNGEFDYQNLNLYRRKLKDFYQKAGSTSIYYINDQGPAEDLPHDFHTWEAINAEVNKNFSQTLMSIPAFFLNKKLWQTDDHSLIFTDDFSDLY